MNLREIIRLQTCSGKVTLKHLFKNESEILAWFPIRTLIWMLCFWSRNLNSCTKTMAAWQTCLVLKRRPQRCKCSLVHCWPLANTDFYSQLCRGPFCFLTHLFSAARQCSGCQMWQRHPKIDQICMFNSFTWSWMILNVPSVDTIMTGFSAPTFVQKESRWMVYFYFLTVMTRDLSIFPLPTVPRWLFGTCVDRNACGKCSDSSGSSSPSGWKCCWDMIGFYFWRSHGPESDSHSQLSLHKTVLKTVGWYRTLYEEKEKKRVHFDIES